MESVRRSFVSTSRRGAFRPVRARAPPVTKTENRRISAEFLKEKINDFNQKYYVCGPDIFVNQTRSIRTELGARPDAAVFEE